MIAQKALLLVTDHVRLQHLFPALRARHYERHGFLSIPRAQRTNAALGQRVALWVVAQSLTTWPTIDRASGSAESQCTPSIIAVTKPMILCWLLRGQGWLLEPQHGTSTTGKMYVCPVIEHGGCRLPHSDWGICPLPRTMLAPTVCGGGTQPCPASQPIGRVLFTTLMPGKVVTCGSKTAQAAVLTPESLSRRVMPATHPPEAVLSQSTSGSCGAP